MKKSIKSPINLFKDYNCRGLKCFPQDIIQASKMAKRWTGLMRRDCKDLVKNNLCVIFFFDIKTFILVAKVVQNVKRTSSKIEKAKKQPICILNRNFRCGSNVVNLTLTIQSQ